MVEWGKYIEIPEHLCYDLNEKTVKVEFFYLSSIAGKFAICGGIRIKKLKEKHNGFRASIYGQDSGRIYGIHVSFG